MSDPSTPHDPLVAAIAKFIREGDHRHLLEQLEEATFDAKQFEAFFISLTSESDRALAIVSFSYVDEKLRQLMLRAMNPRLPDPPERLFETLGPLATASARIKLAAALDWIAVPVYRSLEAHRKIRNEFAHQPFLPGFTDPRVLSLVNNMEHYEEHFSDLFTDLKVDPSTLSTRFLFHFRSMMACHHMITELVTAPLALRLGIQPFRFLDETPDRRPTALRELTAAAGTVAAHLLRTLTTETGPVGA